jgi:hypothetical protein
MGQHHNKEIEKIIGQMQCHKDFLCYKSGFENLCKAKDTRLKSYIECLDENAFTCPFSVPFGSAKFCECPLRVYIAKKLKK